MYQATTTSMTIASHDSAKLPGYENATIASRRKIAPSLASPAASGRLGAVAVIGERHFLEDVDRLGLDRPEVAQRGAVPGDRAHQRAQRAVARLHLHVEVDPALGPHDAQIAEARHGAGAGQQIVVDLVQGHAVARDLAQADVELAG